MQNFHSNACTVCLLRLSVHLRIKVGNSRNIEILDDYPERISILRSTYGITQLTNQRPHKSHIMFDVKRRFQHSALKEATYRRFRFDLTNNRWHKNGSVFHTSAATLHSAILFRRNLP